MSELSSYEKDNVSHKPKVSTIHPSRKILLICVQNLKTWWILCVLLRYYHRKQFEQILCHDIIRANSFQPVTSLSSPLKILHQYHHLGVCHRSTLLHTEIYFLYITSFGVIIKRSLKSDIQKIKVHFSIT